jgi:hypothetical protein
MRITANPKPMQQHQAQGLFVVAGYHAIVEKVG